jgi:hypothetical protein
VNLEEIVESLSTLGIAHEVRRSGADGAILFIPEYGRVLGVWPHLRAENTLWVNDEFFQSLRVGVKDDGWSNPGGDRVWLAPAHEFLLEGRVTPSIDPGRYSLSLDRAAVTMTSRGEAFAYRSEASVKFRLTRRIRPLFEADIDAACGQTWLRRAGWEEELDLEVPGGCPVPVQLWSLTQVPPASETLAGPLRLAGIEDGDSERARLIVKTASSGSASVAEPPLPSVRARPLELSFISPPLPPRGRRLRWKTSTWSFSGRSAEIRQFASRLLYTVPG